MSRASSSRVPSEVEKGAHGLRRDGDAADPLAAEHGGDRREQRRLARYRKARIGAAETVDPGDFRKQPDDAMERQDDADDENADDQAIEPGIGHEGVEDLMLQHEGDQRAQDQEHQHPHQKDAGRAELDFEETVACHRL